jgi:hypothetical protein
MGRVYKVQNMQLIDDNIIHEAISEEDEATVDLHFVVVEEDLSGVVEVVMMAVMKVVTIQILVHHSITMVHHQ